MSQNSFIFIEEKINTEVPNKFYYINKTYFQRTNWNTGLEIKPILSLANSKYLRDCFKEHGLKIHNRPKYLSGHVRSFYKDLNKQITGRTQFNAGIPYFSVDLHEIINLCTSLDQIDMIMQKNQVLVQLLKEKNQVLVQLLKELYYGYYDLVKSDSELRLVIISEG